MASEHSSQGGAENGHAANALQQPFKLAGVQFAPVLIPFERRLQTSAVLLGILVSYFSPLFFSLLFLALLFTPLFFIPILYCTWMYYDRSTPRRGGRRFAFMRGLPVWKYFRDYFPLSLSSTAPLDPERNYLLGCHPHGALAVGAMNFSIEATGFSSLFPGITPFIMTLNMQFRLPMVREYLLSLGMCEVSRESIHHVFTHGKGRAIIIVVGGAEEALEARPGSFTVVLMHRKGFIRQAVQHGADLVPCYTFGENELFKQVDNHPGTKVRSFQERFKNLMSFSPPLLYGRGIFNYNFGLMPFRHAVNTVVGKPIRVEQDDNPSDEKIEHYHRLYVDGLNEVFEKNKAIYTPSSFANFSIRYSTQWECKGGAPSQFIPIKVSRVSDFTSEDFDASQGNKDESNLN